MKLDTASENRNIIQELTQKVTFWGMGANVGLSIIKVVFGLVVHSMALIADGIHSLSDLLTDVIVLVSSKAARRPPESNHPYGHGKFETFGSQFIGMALLIIGGGIGWSAFVSLYKHEESFPGPSAVALGSPSPEEERLIGGVIKRYARESVRGDRICIRHSTGTEREIEVLDLASPVWIANHMI